MKAAVIGAGSESIHTIKKAQEYGIEVIALDGNPKAAGLGAADSFQVVDISDEKAVIKAIGKEKADFVLTAPIGRLLTTVGAVNDALHLPGINREMAVLCTDKFEFHKKLYREGLRKCHCYRMKGDKAIDWSGSVIPIEKAGSGDLALSFPAILKPEYGSGSRGIYMLSDEKQLKEALLTVSGEAYVLEECVCGEEYGVDGAVVEGNFYLTLLRRKKITPPPARQAVGYFSMLPEDSFYGEVRDYMNAAVKCLGLDECLLHADIMKTNQGPFAIELSARPSGHYLHNLFTPLCTGIDPAEEYIRRRIGLSGNFLPRRTHSMLIHYFDMQGKVDKVPDEKQAEQAIDARIEAWECHLEYGQRLRAVSDGHSVMGRGYFVLSGGDGEWLDGQAGKVKKLFHMC